MKNKINKLDFSEKSETVSGADFSSFCPPSLTGVRGSSLVGSAECEGLRALVSFDGGCECSFFGSWFDRSYLEQLEDFQIACKNTDDATIDCGALGSYTCKVYRNGCGGFGKGVRFSYIVDCFSDLGLCFKLYFHKSPCSSIPAVRVHFCYSSLRFARLPDVVRTVSSLLETIGLQITRHCISRLDINITFNRSINYFKEAFEDARFVTRSRKFQTFTDRRGNWETLKMGGAESPQLIIYDKDEELKSKPDDLKIADMVSFFKGEDNLTRVEYSLPRDALYNYKIDTVDDLEEKGSELIEYLTGSFFWIDSKSREGNVNCARARRSVDSVWSWLSTCFHSFFKDKSSCFFVSGSSDITTKAPNVYYVRQNYKKLPSIREIFGLRSFRRKSQTNLKRGLSLIVHGLRDFCSVRMSDDLFMRVAFDAFFKNRGRMIERYDKYFVNGYAVQ